MDEKRTEGKLIPRIIGMLARKAVDSPGKALSALGVALTEVKKNIKEGYAAGDNPLSDPWRDHGKSQRQ